ncbi:SymE family type I addiction module toxin [Pectobacterium jejuense]
MTAQPVVKGRLLKESGLMTGMAIMVTIEWGSIVIETEIDL